jgi:hypothetical protein
VVLAGLEEHAVARPDLLDRPALALAQADALGDEDRLAVRVRVPGRARAEGSMIPGQIALMRLPWSASSSAADFVSPMTPCLVAA